MFNVMSAWRKWRIHGDFQSGEFLFLEFMISPLQTWVYVLKSLWFQDYSPMILWPFPYLLWWVDVKMVTIGTSGFNSLYVKSLKAITPVFTTRKSWTSWKSMTFHQRTEVARQPATPKLWSWVHPTTLRMDSLQQCHKPVGTLRW